MDLSALVFYFFSLVTIVSAGVMVFSKNIVHSAFALMFSLLGVAVLYVLLYADFIAATQLLVYVGGILILILFGMMLTNQGFTEKFEAITVNLLPASLMAAVTSVLLIYTYIATSWATVIPQERSATVYDLGMLLMNDYVLPFIVVGVLLLIAIIGAILMSTRLTATPNE